jgi:hypothetical protein
LERVFCPKSRKHNEQIGRFLFILTSVVVAFTPPTIHAATPTTNTRSNARLTNFCILFARVAELDVIVDKEFCSPSHDEV